MKIMRNLEDAKWLSKEEITNNREDEKYKDEIALQTIDLDYDTIHSEILENIILDENDSAISDFDTKEEENPKKKTFQITKIKTLIHKNVKLLFANYQEDDQYNPLIQLESKKIKKEIINEENEKENGANVLSTNNEIKTQENTDDFNEDIKENNIIKNEKENIDNNSNDIATEKQEEIVNYKKYNFFTDPYSNYNNFTNKYKIKNTTKKRFRDIHPFLKTFNPKFLKKENIDKKIFRRFRKFVKTYYKENKNSPIFSKNIFFWKKFYVKNLLPPIKIISNNDQIIEHKSFNTQYLIWLFNQEGITELFNLFIEKESENVINNFISEYNLYKSKESNIIEKLKQYIKYIPEIYDSYNNGQKKTILEENKEMFDTNEFSGKRENALESYESDFSDNNPFNLKFDLVGKKNFKEYPYDNSNSYYNRKENYNDYLNNIKEECNKEEKSMDDDSYFEQYPKNYFK